MNPTPASPLPESHSPNLVPPRDFVPPIEMFKPQLSYNLLSIGKDVGDGHSDPSGADAIREMRSPLEEKKASFNSPAPPTVRLADVPQRGVEWLWPDRIPLGKITLLAGDPGVGKSLITLDIAARVTRGAPFPDDPNPESPTANPDSQPLNPEPRTLNPPRSVLLLSAEDDLADTIRPRLEALDADCSRIIALTAQAATSARPAPASSPLTPDSRLLTPFPFDLSRDVALLDDTLESLPDCALVVIDPISAYLGRAVENVNAEVRRIMAPLAELAERRRVAILVVSHLRKQAGAAVHRTIGSLAFVASARTAWLVTKDSQTAVDYTPERRLLVPIKNNIAPDTNGLACSIEPHPDAGLPIVRWSTEPLDIDADEALTAFATKGSRPAEERRDASRWLRSHLAPGPLPTKEISEAAAAHGFSIGTLRRAFRDVGGVAVKTGYGTTGKWFWHLPA